MALSRGSLPVRFNRDASIHAVTLQQLCSSVACRWVSWRSPCLAHPLPNVLSLIRITIPGTASTTRPCRAMATTWLMDYFPRKAMEQWWCAI